MSQFPETRQTLIRRIAEVGADADWRQFLADYWKPICRFSARCGQLNLDDAEDITSLVFLAILEGKLFERWLSSPQSKLRTLVCSVVRNVISNRARVQSGRERILRENREFLVQVGRLQGDEDGAVTADQNELFYAAWAEELLQRSLDQLQQDYLSTGKGDYFRVLYGRICVEMSNSEVAESLQLKVTDVENFFRRARETLREQLQLAVSEHVRRYCPAEECDAEIAREWDRLGEYLQRSGGMEVAIRSSYEFSGELSRRQKNSQTTILKYVRERHAD
ncbi:MAG: hypothetical protein R3C18_26105 [Planctomycetaceae bacterium]